MAGPIAYLDGVSGDGSPVWVSGANPLPITGVSVTIAGVTIADGSDAAEGAKADAAVTDPTASASVIAALKGLLTLNGAWPSSNHITTSTTTTIAGAHTLHTVSVNAKGTVASAVTVKDGATTLAVIDSLNNVGTWTFDFACATSIVIVTTGTTPPDVTVVYR